MTGAGGEPQRLVAAGGDGLGNGVNDTRIERDSQVFLIGLGLDPDAVSIYREVRSRHLAEDQLPASTLVGVERLVHPDLLLEVELVAAVAEKRVPRKKAGR